MSAKRPPESPERDIEGNPMKRQNSLPDLSVAAKHSQMFTGVLPPSCSQASYMSEIVPVLVEALKPTIESTVKSVMTGLLSELRSQLLDPFTKEREEIIKALNKKIDEKDNIIKSLSDRVESLTVDVVQLKNGLDGLEQYGRRSNLQLSNIKLVDPAQCEEKVIGVLNKILPEGSAITAADIERCHPLGQANKFGNRQIIVKFRSIKTKQVVYSNKSRLKYINTSTDPGNKVYISEDLTKQNQDLVRRLRNLRSSKTINSYWTIDGKVFCKKQENSTKVRIMSQSDIDLL